MTEIHIKWPEMTSTHHNHWFWENWEKFSKKFSDFGGGDVLSNRFFERAPTFTNFLRLAFDRPSWDLQFEPYDDLTVAYAQKILRNYEIFMTKS